MISTEKSSEGVYFLSLSLENVRCFAEKQTLDLSDGNGRPAQWTVILGDNGTGKTTLLECMNVFYTNVNKLRRYDNLNILINLIVAYDNVLQNKQKKFQKIPIASSLHHNGFLGPNGLSEKLKIYSYSATRRISRVETKLDYDELINAEKWLLDTDYIANKPSEIQEKYKNLLEIVKNTLINLLPDVSDIRISVPTEQAPNPRAEFKTNDGWLLLNQLSLGYQTMTAWIVDLAAQLFRDYPNSPNPIVEPAVVLIDEIDLHLHPKWQRTIMSYLSERFINTQFIVTAHSPLIVQAAENANIVVLKREANGVVIKKQPEDVHGWRVDQLLTSDLFNLSSARSPHYENLLQQRRDILSKAELNNEDKEKLKVLETEMGYLPTAETAEDIKAMDIIRRAAQLLKQ
ncbi:MAG: AAA family ATPase [Methylococcaceae bacterium]